MITDDAGTQGQGKFQLEINGQNDYDREEGIKTEKTSSGTTFSYGIIDSLDIVVGICYQFLKIENGASTQTDGLSDVAVDLKWKFYKKDNFALALKPGITLPSADEQKGLGAGKATYYLFFISSLEKKPWAFLLGGIIYSLSENFDFDIGLKMGLNKPETDFSVLAGLAWRF